MDEQKYQIQVLNMKIQYQHQQQQEQDIHSTDGLICHQMERCQQHD